VSLRVLVSGMVAGDPHQGGATWAVLQWVLGLRALGHDAWLVEPVDRLDGEVVRYFEGVVAAAGLEGRAALLVRGTRETAGTPYEALAAAAAGADLLLNVSGMLRDEALLAGPAVRAYLDLDPAFVQLWHAVEGIDMGLDAHERFVTVGLNLGGPGCDVPTCDREWITTPPPVVLEQWPAAPGAPEGAWTTIGNWRGYGSVTWKGVQYGQKAHSVRALADLPARTTEPVLAAFAIHPGETPDLALLARHGWALADPRAVAGTPAAYRAFLGASRGELGIAKHGYVASRCGWFSDRSACYLASGRPVVAQETGFSAHLPCGEGLLAFADAEGAAAAMEEVALDPARHGRAARALAEAHLDARRVLPRLLERVL
jgi:hypothetical protein